MVFCYTWGMSAATETKKANQKTKTAQPETAKLLQRIAGALDGPSGEKVIKAMGRKLP
jgi:hypothetical protein